jgi:hypothetical protein
VPRILLTVGGKRFEGKPSPFRPLLNSITNFPFCHSADHRYPFYKKEGGGFSTPEMDADWEKGIFPMGQVPVLQANGHRFPQVRPSRPRAGSMRMYMRIAAG